MAFTSSLENLSSTCTFSISVFFISTSTIGIIGFNTAFKNPISILGFSSEPNIFLNTKSILGFKYLKNDRFHNGYRLKEIETNEELTDIEEIHFIEIPKLKKLNSEEEVVDMLEAWVEFLRDPESEVVRKLEMSNSEIREAKDKLYKLSMDEKERELYFLREKSIKDEISALANAEEKGIQIGIEQGIKQGMQQGIQEGIQREKIETVLRLKSLGLNIEQIAKGTCITETEVEKIIKENIN